MQKKYSLNHILKALNISKSSYYYWLFTKKKNEEKRIWFYQKLIEVYARSNGIYGAPKICAELNSIGINCSISRVSRAMVVLGIKSSVAKRFPKKVPHITLQEKAMVFNLIKNLIVDHLNQVWTTDITYIQTINDGTLYLISFIDYFSKKVVAWGLFYDQKSDKVLKVLENAVSNRNTKKGLIIHSDKGSVFRSGLYRKYLSSHHFIYSYTSWNHSCDENAAQESFHAQLKKEAIYQTKLYNYEDAYRVIFDYIEGFYNPNRIHSSIGYLSPNEFEAKINAK